MRTRYFFWLSFSCRFNAPNAISLVDKIVPRWPNMWLQRNTTVKCYEINFFFNFFISVLKTIIYPLYFTLKSVELSMVNTLQAVNCKSAFRFVVRNLSVCKGNNKVGIRQERKILMNIKKYGFIH